MLRKCLDCGEELVGRADKKFCSDLCRNNYNNQNRKQPAIIRQVNTILTKNHNILTSLNPDGKVNVHRDKLTQRGFNFNYFTGIYRTKTGSTYYFCYDQGYLPLDNNFYMLVVKKET